jgi:hypothetical protein
MKKKETKLSVPKKKGKKDIELRITKGEKLLLKENNSIDDLNSSIELYIIWSDYNIDLIDTFFSNKSNSIDYSENRITVFPDTEGLEKNISTYKNNLRIEITNLKSIINRLDLHSDIDTSIGEEIITRNAHLGGGIKAEFVPQLTDLNKISSKKQIIQTGTNSNEISSKIKFQLTKDKLGETHPLYIGVLFDLSSSMWKTLLGIQEKSTTNDNRKLNQAFRIIAQKIIAFCKTPESRQILPIVKLFLYGFGFGNLRKNIMTFFSDIEVIGLEDKNISSSSIRDLFEEISQKENITRTPNTFELNSKWDLYKESVESQFLDIGDREPQLYKSLTIVHNRYLKELKSPHYFRPFLLLLSNGEIEENENSILDIADKIKEKNIQIICLLLSKNQVLEDRTLYDSESNSWPEGINTLFKIASKLDSSEKITHKSVSLAKEKGWSLSPNSRLLIQINQKDLLEELIDIILEPIK